MAKIDLKEILAGVAAGVVLPVITTLVTEGLENLQESKGDKKHKQALLLATAFVSVMEDIVAGTKTKLDDRAFEAIGDGVKASAALHDVDLSGVEALLAEAEKLA